MSDQEPTNELARFNPATLVTQEWINKGNAMITAMQYITAITSDDELAASGKLQTQASKAIKALGRERLSITRKIDAFKKEFTDKEKALVGPIQIELDRIKRLNNEYATLKAAEAEAARAEQQRQEQEAAAKLYAEQQERERAAKSQSAFGDSVEVAPEPVVLPEPVEQAPIPSGKAYTPANKQVAKWDFEVVDSALVPREQCTVDPKKIRATMKYQISMGQDPVIPGVRFNKSISVQSR